MGAMLRDFSSLIKLIQGIKPDAHAASTIDGASVDTNFCNGVALFYDFADKGAAGTAVFKLQDSADNSAFADVAGITTATLTAPETGILIAYKKTRRYVRAVLVAGANAIDASAVIALYDSKENPNPL